MNKEEIVIRMMEMLRQSEDDKDRAFVRMTDGEVKINGVQN